VLEGLNAPQRDAITHVGSPLLIVAGAGSGKTRVLTRRIAYLLAARDVHPGSVLAITFTNKAAGEMKERVAALVGRRANAMWVSTFHSACVRILRREGKRFGFTSTFTIYDQTDAQRLMTLVCRDLDLDPKRYPPRHFSNQVSNLKNELIDHETAAARAASHHEKTIAEAYGIYQRRLAEANAFDFDDLIMTTVHLLQAFPDVAEHYRRRFRHVLVDEYQDTNHAQYVLVRELVGTRERRTVEGDLVGSASSTPEVPPAELCVVGDADQSIYAFRGATIRNILQFEADYPDARVILLEQNYRSTQTILSAANAVISRNPDRKPKRLWTDSGDGAKVVGYVADDEHMEAQFVAEEIDRLSDESVARPGDVAVFYRTNAQSRVLEEVFIRVGLPYRVVGGVRFYERREVRDALAYLRTLANPDDSVSLRRILNVPRRGIGDRAQALVEALSQREGITFWQALRRAADAPGIATRSVRAIESFVALVDDPRRQPPRTGGSGRRVRGVSGCRDRRRNAHRLPRAGQPRRRCRRHPGRRGPRRRGHADDSAHGQRAGVPGRVPDRPRGRRLPARPVAHRAARTRGGAPPRLCRHHPVPRTALPVQGNRPQRLGRAQPQPSLTVPRRDPGRARRLAPYGGRPDPVDIRRGERRPLRLPACGGRKHAAASCAGPLCG
jgi:DNA helicase-2/ATP-dependent DNA helicase PcrA